jgi:hypothetical protein
MQYLMRAKIVNSGLPPNWSNTEQYCQHVNESMGYTGSACIEPHELQRNDQKRFCSKQAICSVFGKLLQKDHNTQFKVVYSQGELEKYFCQTKDHDTIRSISVISDEEACLIEVQRKKYPIIRSRHYVSGAHILSYARIKAHKAMSRIEECNCKLLYHDCDSFFYIRPKSQESPFNSFGELPGEMKNVFPNSTITSFYCAGVKSYSVVYESDNILHEKIVCKGLCLSSLKASQSLTAAVYRRQIEAFLSQTKETVQIVKIQQSRNKVSNDMVPVRAFCQI